MFSGLRAVKDTWCIHLLGGVRKGSEASMNRRWKVEERQRVASWNGRCKVNERQWVAQERRWELKERQWKFKERQ